MFLSGMVESPSPLDEEKFIYVAIRRYQIRARTRTDLKVHLIWISKYRKRVLIGPVAIRARDVLRHIAFDHELEVASIAEGSPLRVMCQGETRFSATCL